MALLITGVIDGPLVGGFPKAIELTATADIADLSIFGLSSPNNGSPSQGGADPEFDFPAISLSAGDTFYVSFETTGFTNFFGFPPDATGVVASINGDDAVELYESGTLIDVFGVVGTDGTGEPWEHSDGWAYRSMGTAASPIFNLSDWTFSGTNALDGENTNDTAATPFPTGSFDVTIPSAPVVVAAEDFDGGTINLVSGFVPATGNLDGGPGDFFGVANLGAWPQASGIPFSLVDDTVVNLSGSSFSDDVEGIFGQNRDQANDFFAVADTRDFGELATASWTFDIVGFEDLSLSIDMGGISDSSFGGFGTDIDVQFLVSIDGGTSQVAFDLDAVDPGSFTTRPMDDGTQSGGGRVLQVSGDDAITKLLTEDGSEADNTFLDKSTTDTGALDSFVTTINGSGASLTLTVISDVPFEAMAFDNIEITGTASDVAGSVFSIEPTDADKAEGDSGTTTYIFTVNRAGDTTGAASVDFVVTGDVDAADFAGTLPSGTVDFADGETTATIELSVSGDTIIENDESFTVTLSNPVGGTIASGTADGRIANDDLEITLISAIQGNAATWGEQFGRTDATPFFGATVLVEAIVVGDFQDGGLGVNGDYNGFYLQEEDTNSDGDATTSEGIFVFDGFDQPLDIEIGDKVQVQGTATEFFGETQIDATNITVLEKGVTVPTPGTIEFPVAQTITNSDGQLIADLEAYEGMLVTVPQTLTVGDLFTYGRFGEIGLSANGRVAAYTSENAPSVDGFADYLDEQVRSTVVLDDGSTAQNPPVLPFPDGDFDALDDLTSGDTVTDLTGVVRFSRNSGTSGDENYRINAVDDVVFENTNPREDTPPDVGGRLKVATFNVLNYFTSLGDEGLTAGPNNLGVRGADNQEEFVRQSEKLISALETLDADVIGLVELENEYTDANGDGQVAIETLVNLLNEVKPDANYTFVDPGETYGGDDAIMVGLIYDQNTVDIAAGSTVEILDDTDLSGLGLDFGNPVFNGSGTSRAPITATFEELATGETFNVTVNHFKSKGSVSPFGNNQGIGDGTGNNNEARAQAAKALETWLATDPTGGQSENTLIVGDLNAYKMEDPIQELFNGVDDVTGTEDDFVNLDEDYSFGFPLDLNLAGQVQGFGALDYALASSAMASQVTGAATWHINADEPGYIDYNTNFKPDDPGLFSPDPFRSSDHDPIIVGLDLGEREPNTVVARVDVIDKRWAKDKLVYSVDGEKEAATRIKLLEKDISFKKAGIEIDASDGRFGPEFINSASKGFGIWSVFGDGWRDGTKKTIDEKETLNIALVDEFQFGSATAAKFEFGKVQGAGQVELSFFSDEELIERALLDVQNNVVSYALESSASFNEVEVALTGSLSVSVTAFEFDRLIEADAFEFV